MERFAQRKKTCHDEIVISFDHPHLLLLAVPLFYLLWKIQENSFTGAARFRRMLWLSIRSLLLILLLLALAGLQWKTEVRQKQVLFLVDLSDSMHPTQRERAHQWLNEAIELIRPPDQVGVILFGSDAQVERFPGTPFPLSRFESRVDGSATSMENAMRLAEALFAGNYQKNVILLSDGLENSGQALRLIQNLKQKGISLQASHFSAPEIPEAGLEAIRIPDEVRLRETFPLEVVASSNRTIPALVQVFRNGTLLQEGSIELTPDRKTFFRLPQQIDRPGLYRYEVRLKPAEDFRTENNLVEGWTMVQGPPRILLIDERPDDVAAFARMLQSRGYEIDLKPASFFPRTIQEMLLYQSILIRNVSASAIHSQMPLIRSYVKDFGGGFAMLGGRRSFGPGGFYNTPVEETLPVRMDLVNKKYLADVAMVIVIDKSGSMSFSDRGRQKIDLADEGGARVASLLKKTDQLGVLAVDSVPKWAYELQKLANQTAAIDAITSIRAGGGGIYVYSGLREAYTTLANARASVKHVILFADTADCEEKDGPGGESSQLLAQRALDKYQITTTTIGIGQSGDPDVQFLRDVATIGQGRFYFTSDMFTLPEIFTEESSIVQRYYITEETFIPRISDREPVLTGLDQFPELQGYVATTAKPQANVGLRSHRDDPVLAFWRFGMGQSVAFTSDPGLEWSQKWTAWADFSTFWSQILRYLNRQTQSPNFRATISPNQDHTTIIVETFDSVKTAADSRSFRAVLVDRNNRSHTIDLEQTASGRFEASVPQTGSLFGKVFRIENDQVMDESILQSPGSAGSEYQSLGANTETGKKFLAQIADGVVEKPSELRFPAHSAIDLEPLRRTILFLAAFLFLLDVALRKIDLRGIRWRKEKAAPEPEVSVQAPLQQLKLRKSDLKQQVPFELTLEIPEIPQIEAPPELVQEPQLEQSEYLQRLKEAKKKHGKI